MTIDFSCKEMKMNGQNLKPMGATALLAALVLALSGCGGGGASSAGTTGGTELASGVVTGFGSVFVDGVEIEDAHAQVVSENADGSLSNVVLRMGQRVRVSHDGRGTASRVTLDAAVIGGVSGIDVAGKTLTVAAQKVLVNDNAALGPLTAWGGGYASLADVRASDLVEVHGSPVYDSATTSYQVRATRIQKMPVTAGIQVGGKISLLDTVAKTFVINGLQVSYASAELRPVTAALSNGLMVRVYGPTTGLSGGNLTASHVKVHRLHDDEAGATLAQVGGEVSAYDAAAAAFEVDGVRVLIGSARVTPVGAVIGNDAYVKVSGTLGSDGSIAASAIQVRQGDTDDDLAKVRLLGVISDFVDAGSFVVRGVPVDASAAHIEDDCPTLANEVVVQVKAVQQAGTPVVRAEQIECKTPQATAIVMRPLAGTVSAVDVTAKTFVLTGLGEAGKSGTVQWNDRTVLVGLSDGGMSAAEGKTVRVEGYLSNGVLVARVVVLATSTAQREDDDDFHEERGEDVRRAAWNAYRANLVR